MRCCLAIAVAVLALSANAFADDVAVGAAVGAGGQGDAGYGALELRLDGEWRGVRIGLGGRAVWEGGAFRTREWSRPVDAIALIRQLEASLGPVALAAGALAPSTIGHVADGYRQALDDRARTGARIAVTTHRMRTRAGGLDASASDRDARPGVDRDPGAHIDLEASAEIDDVLDPALVGGALAWQLVPAWGVRAATAVDPATSRIAIEVGGARRWERDDSRVELGASIVGERWRATASGDSLGRPHIGLGAVGFANVAFDRANARWTLGADVRAGTGTNGAAFGPLYRAERATRIGAGADAMGADVMGADVSDAGQGSASRAILDEVHAGVGGGISASVSADRGWLSIGGRWRPGLGALGTIGAGAPMNRWLQGAGWIATSPRVTAGVAELRAVWATHFYTALSLARMYITDEAALDPAWSATVWFGATSR